MRTKAKWGTTLILPEVRREGWKLKWNRKKNEAWTAILLGQWIFQVSTRVSRAIKLEERQPFGKWRLLDLISRFVWFENFGPQNLFLVSVYTAMNPIFLHFVHTFLAPTNFTYSTWKAVFACPFLPSTWIFDLKSESPTFLDIHLAKIVGFLLKGHLIISCSIFSISGKIGSFSPENTVDIITSLASLELE